MYITHITENILIYIYNTIFIFIFDKRSAQILFYLKQVFYEYIIYILYIKGI